MKNGGGVDIEKIKPYLGVQLTNIKDIGPAIYHEKNSSLAIKYTADKYM